MEQSEVKKSDNNNFANKKSPLQKVGEFLREARQGRSITIEDLSASLRIGKEQLIALESGDEDSLPEKVFIKAMVRRIAEKLSLDTSFILEELNEKKKSEPNLQQSPQKVRKVSSVKLNPIFMVLISATLGLITSIMVLKHIERNPKESLNSLNNYILLLDNHRYYNYS